MAPDLLVAGIGSRGRVEATSTTLTSGLDGSDNGVRVPVEPAVGRPFGPGPLDVLIRKERNRMDRREFTKIMGAVVAGMVAGSKASPAKRRRRRAPRTSMPVRA